MPIYEYKCYECSTISERLLMGGEVAKDISCCQCGSPRVEKILSTVSLLSRDFANVQWGHTCCGQEERCESPPCSSGSSCKRA